MGWKADTVLIRPAGPGEGAEALLRDLGFTPLTPLGEHRYEQAIWPDEHTVWVGSAGDCLMISARGLSDAFFEPKPAPLAQALFRRFPRAEIAAVTLHSVVNLWGFALFSDGNALRRKAGSADDGTFEDTGDPLPEERELLAKSTLNAKGQRVYRLPEFPDEDMTEDQVGEEYVFKIFERLAGERPDIGPSLLDTRCAGFRFSSIAAGTSAAPWWKFWR